MTTEQVVYEVPIARETTYEENSSIYVGSNKTLSAGSDGVMQE